MHCPDRSVPTPATDSGDDRPILGHGNGFAKLHAHDDVVGAEGRRYGRGHDRWREILMASDCRNTQVCAPDEIRQPGSRTALTNRPVACRPSVDVMHTSYRPCEGNGPVR